MLLKEEISAENLQSANMKLNKFVEEFQNLYGNDNVTMNLHLLLHLPTAVKNLGPLWCQSAFGFDSNNGVLLKLNTCKRDILHSLAWKYVMKKTLNEYEEVVSYVQVHGRQVIRLNPEEMLMMRSNRI